MMFSPRSFRNLSLLFVLTSLTPGQGEVTTWKLTWSDEFNGQRIDSTKWSPCERGTADWNDTMTRNPECFRIGGGTLRLMGLVNPDKTKNASPFLTGGITTRQKFQFTHGKIEVRARFKSARGAWPAIWMLGNHGRWPECGEMDLMEHLNFDEKGYQTIHSAFTHSPSGKDGPPKGTNASIRRDDWNTYGAEWAPEKIIFTVNGKPTMTYPKVKETGRGQWPFDRPFYLIFSMQICGAWVGPVKPDDYPAYLEIDWVRVHQSSASISSLEKPPTPPRAR